MSRFFRALHWDSETQDVVSLELLRSTTWKEPVGSEANTEKTELRKTQGYREGLLMISSEPSVPIHAQSF